MKPLAAVALGVLLILVALGAFLLSTPRPPTSVGLEVFEGLVLLSLCLVGLIIVSQALGLATPHQALGLASGSVRALIAFSLIVAFVAIASWTLGDHTPASVSNTITAHEQQLFDLQKQILTIVATALVTVIGFYFGSKSSSDAATSAGATIAAVQKALSGDGTSAAAQDATASPTVAGLKQTTAQIRAIATAAQSKRDALGADPLADLQEAVAGQADAKLQAQLNGAKTAIDQLGKGVSATDTFADQAEAAVGGLDPTKTDAAMLQPAQAKLTELLKDATKADADFSTALAAFTDARDAILTATAKG